MSELIQITTEYLLQKKEEWEAIVGCTRKEISDALETTGTLNECFNGEVVRTFQSSYQKHQENTELLLQSLSDHIGKLEEIAKVYEQTERSNSVGIG